MSSSAKPKKLKFETLQVHAGQETADPATDSRAPPIYQTTSYVFHNCQDAADRFALRKVGNIYTRLTNPTQQCFEERITALEGGVASLATSSGSSAIFYTILNLTKVGEGDHIVSANQIYGGTFNMFTNTLPTYGIKTTFVNPDDLSAFEKAVTPKTRGILIEIIGNPNSNIVNVEAIAEIAHKNKIPLIVDNTFATPFLFRPFEHNADIVVHSCTKFIGGHGTTMGGVIVDSGKFDWTKSGKFPQLVQPDPSYHGLKFHEAVGAAAFVTRIRAVLLRDIGACISPFNAFLLIQGLETLSLRVERHVQNTLKVIKFLKNHKKVEAVHHPAFPDHPNNDLYKKYFPNGASSIFTFEVKGDSVAACKVVDSLKIFSLLANVADVKSLVIHPGTTTHSQLSEKDLLEQFIKPNTIRLSIGIENADDLIDDLDQALNKI